LTVRLRVTSSDGGKSWPELGFWFWERNSREEGIRDFFRVSQRPMTSYRGYRVAAFIWCVDGDGRHPWRHWAAWRKVEDDLLPRSFRWSGTGLVGQHWAGLDGLGQVSSSSLFFSSSISFIFVLFSGFNSSIWIQSYLQGFELETSYQI
jgi:hypothetical protein